jgi:hypothetical protein
MEEMNALGAQKKVAGAKARVQRLSRQGVFATQFVESRDGNGKSFFSKAVPPGRTRGSVEMKASDMNLQKVYITYMALTYFHDIAWHNRIC